MSDISIPGVPGASRFDTDKMIEELMAVERVTLDRMEEKLESIQNQKKAWQSVNRRLNLLRDSAKSLFGFENPFNERIASSSQSDVLTAIATREATESTNSMEVKSVATRDRFLSKSFQKNYQVKSGAYGFAVGDREIRFAFKGGDLADFAETIRERSNGLLNAQVVNDTTDTKVILIESTKTGSSNTLQFLDDAADFALDAAILKRSDDASRTLTLNRSSVRRLDTPISEDILRFESDTIRFLPESSASIPISPTIVAKENLMLEIEVTITNIPYEFTESEPPPGPTAPAPGKISFQGIEVENVGSRMAVPLWDPPQPPEKRDDLRVFFAQAPDGSPNEAIPLPPLKDVEGSQTIQVPLKDYLDSLSAIQVKNNNTHREISVEGVRIYDPESRGDFVPVSPVETANDAVLYFEGIEIKRSTNDIDDLIPGVTLTLLKPSEGKITLDVEPDREAIKETIIEFVGYYDRLLAEVNILTGTSEDIVTEITYFTDNEREDAQEILGALQGDITLMQLKSRVQTILMNPYPTSLGRDLTLLDQMGISTNASRSGSAGLDRGRLRGYLEINEDKLDKTLETEIAAVKELFGRDTDRDLIVDNGAAYTLDAYIRPYVETGGLISNRLNTIDNQYRSTSTRIETEQEKIAKKERDYRRQFGVMEGALNSLERSSEQIDNFNRNAQREN